MELAKTMDVTAATEEFFTKVNPIMKAKGYKRKASKQSAAGDWTYTKGDKLITLSGWHGQEVQKWGEGMMLTSSWTTTVNPYNQVEHEILVMSGRDKSEYGAGMPDPVKHPRGYMCRADEFAVYKENLGKLLEYLKGVE